MFEDITQWTIPKMKVVAVIPALNCEKQIGRVVSQLKPFVDETIVIDDGSVDNTKIKGHLNGAQMISHPKNWGLGAALCTGFRAALRRQADIIVTLDGDGQHKPQDIKKVIDLLINNHCDVVIGSRLLKKKNYKYFPRHRLWGNLILTSLTNSAIGQKVTTDSQSGYRAFKRKVVEKMKLTSARMAVSSEIVFEAAKNNFVIKEVPIKPTYEDETSNQRLIVDPLRIIGMLIKKRMWKLL